MAGIAIIIFAFFIFKVEQKNCKNNKLAYYNCYTDRIECFNGARKTGTYYMTPDVTPYLMPQDHAQRKRGVGSIVIVISRNNTLFLKDIPDHKRVYQQLCGLYHLEQKSMFPPIIPSSWM